MRWLDEHTAYGKTALVAVETALYNFDRLYEYIIPGEFEERIGAGQRVSLHFGRGQAPANAMVFEVREREFSTKELKYIKRLADNQAVLNDEQLRLAVWIKENTFCTYYDAVRLLLPAKSIDPSKAKQTGKANQKLRLAFESGGKGTEPIAPIAENNDILPALPTAKQRQVLDFLAENGTASTHEITQLCGVGAGVVSALIKKGLIQIAPDESEAERNGGDIISAASESITLSAEQRRVYDGISALMNSPEAKCALLRGVTGSGKTLVFIELIKQALNREQTALMLVPEISLTPQMTKRFVNTFGGIVAVTHSGLTLTERAQVYERIRKGEARIVIGARSAVFAPLNNIGIIIIDEEGEHTYRSENNPRYHARNIAKQRAFYHKALLLLASATPSLESYHFAATGRYALFELNERYGESLLPIVKIADMREERGNFSDELKSALIKTRLAGEQSLLLINRRGYHTYVSCMSCSTALTCPNCRVALTYHKPGNRVMCHYCGYYAPLPQTCPNCGSVKINAIGSGTQRIEDELADLLPGARILRMDSDTTRTRGVYERQFADFAAGEYDVMVGTQMIAKGLDFENVTLVGVLQIDKALYSGDYMGYEQTFSLITQVVGRSGRAAKPGRAIIQTYTPEHYVLRLAAKQDYPVFYNNEIAVRRELVYPPFCDICNFVLSHADERVCEQAAVIFADIFAQKASGLPTVILGPTKAGTGSIMGKFRQKLLVKCKNNKAFRRAASEALIAARQDRTNFNGTSIYAEINGAII
jgi:primosomal protein N' (replication factor Y)